MRPSILALLLCTCAAPAAAQTFCNPAPIAVPGAGTSGPAAPYPSTLAVSGGPLAMDRVRVQFNGLAHTFPSDIEVLLVAPDGTNFVPLADAGGSATQAARILAIDSRSTRPLPSLLVDGMFAPSAGTAALPPPAPAVQTAPAGFGPRFAGRNANGTWQLFVGDDAGGDVGRFANGWCLSFGAPPLLISEMRSRGPGGAADEYIELVNASLAPLPLTPVDTSTHLAVAGAAQTLCTIPAGTLMPPLSHLLCTGSGYTLAAHPAGAGTATGDFPMLVGLGDGAGVAVFESNATGFRSLALRLDAVGFAGNDALLREGAGLAVPSGDFERALVRDDCGKQGNADDMGRCPGGGFPLDTADNARDFLLLGTAPAAGTRHGAPGPQNADAPRFGGGQLVVRPLGCGRIDAPPNLVRDFTPDPANNASAGTIEVRRRITNLGLAPLTRLRLRVIDLSTLPAPLGRADLRAITSGDIVATIDPLPCGGPTENAVVRGTVLELPPAQPLGGGVNSTFAVPLPTPLAGGASIDVRVRFGLQQAGSVHFTLAAEGVPAGGGSEGLIEVVADRLFADGFENAPG